MSCVSSAERTSPCEGDLNLSNHIVSQPVQPPLQIETEVAERKDGTVISEATRHLDQASVDPLKQQPLQTATEAPAQPTSSNDWQLAYDSTSGAWYYYNLVTSESRWAVNDPEHATTSHVQEVSEQHGVVVDPSLEEQPTGSPGPSCEAQRDTERTPTTDQTVCDASGEPATTAVSQPGDAVGNSALILSASADTTYSIAPSNSGQADVDDQTAAAHYTMAHHNGHTSHPAYAWPYHQPVEGWYYQDVHSYMQGPYAKAQLRGWRDKLPMDLALWYYDKAGVPAQSSMELAKVIGDSKLLAAWKEQNEAKAGSSSNAAPDAATFEAQRQQGNDTFSEYVNAVLAGLPPEDDSVKIAQLAAQAGTSVQNVLNFSYGSASGRTVEVQADQKGQYAQYTVTAQLGGRGRGRSADTSLYGDLQSWCDASRLEESLSAAKERRKQLPPSVVQKLRERKKEMKLKQKKSQLSWLYT